MALPPGAAESLTDKEREALRLLAEGHTIKTAAAQLGASEAAINERLRSARRKTGATSSRDLARQLFLQETCDDFPGVSSPAAEAETGGDGAAKGPRRWTRRRIVLMSALALFGGALAAAAYLSAPAAPPADAALPPLAGPGAELRKALEAEPADPRWAEATQAELSRRFAAREGVGIVMVRCRTSLCEVNAAVAAEDRSRAIRAVSDKAFVASLAEDGLGRAEAFDFRFVDGDKGAGTVTVFLERVSPAARR